VSYIGYLTKDVNTAGKTTLDITLSEDAEALEEIVVVGYGTQRKSDVTGSIAVATAGDILKTSSFNALAGLKGKASGVNIFTNSGQPGGPTRVMIRGIGTINSSSNPLYVVDGVVMEDFQFLNPNDIERIEVLFL
jgi:outer membrane receptor protein involved in Fe transport